MIGLLKASPVLIPVILILILFLGGDKYFTDSDGDGISDHKDNCQDISNPSQIDSDKDSTGDDCEQNNKEKLAPVDYK